MEWRNATAVAVTVTRAAVQAMVSTIQVDMLAGARFRYCAQKARGRLFRLGIAS